MSTSYANNLIVGLLAVVSLNGCGAPPSDPSSETRSQNEARRPEPISSLQYHLEVDPDSLPAGVVMRERQVPGTGQSQIWVRNESEIPFVIISVNQQGSVVRRQKLVDRKTYVESPTFNQASAGAAAPRWQLLEGVEEVLIALQYTPGPIVAGRTQPVTEVPAPEPFSIQTIFGGVASAIRGNIIYSATAPGDSNNE